MAKSMINCMRIYWRGKTKTQNTIKNSILIVCIAVMAMLQACKKDTNKLSVDFISPDSTFSTTFKTFPLKAYTAKMDSLPTFDLSLYVLGAINDPILGVSRANIITTYSIPNNAASFSFGTNALIDSVVLQLRIGTDSTFVGDISSVHNIKVYELSKRLTGDSVYYSNRPYAASTTVIGEYNDRFRPSDSIYKSYVNSSVVVPPSLRIKLSNDFRTKLQNAGTLSSGSFYDVFAGFAIVDESNFNPNQGSFAYINLNSIYTNMVVYYKNDTTNLRAEFPIYSTSPKYNHYITNSSGFNQPLFNGAARDTGYAQALGGTKVRVFIPQNVIDSLALQISPQLAIQKAELVIDAYSGFDNDYFRLPTALVLLGSDSLGRHSFIKDAFSEGSTYIGGGLNADRKQYRFNLARELNYIIKERKQGINSHFGFNIIVPNSSSGSVFPTSARRAVLNTKNLKLNITYTVVE
jgi:hypothetical protein